MTIKRPEEYLAPDFDPHSLRVVDLKEILNKYHITYSSKDRKAQLIKIFKEKGLKKISTEFEGAKKDRTPAKQEHVIVTPIKKQVIKPESRSETHKLNVHRVSKSPSKESRRAIRRLLTEQRSPSKVSPGRARIEKRRARSRKLKDRKNPFQSTIPSKRPYDSEDDSDDTSVYRGYSKILKRPTNRKDDFSSSSPLSSPKKIDGLFPRGSNINFDSGDKKKQKDESKKLEESKAFKEPKLPKDEPIIESPSSDGSVVYRPKEIPSSPLSTKPEGIKTSNHPKVTIKPISVTPNEIHTHEPIKVDHLLGPTEPIKIETKISPAAESSPVKTEIASDSEMRIHTPDVGSSEEDETVLKQLQDEFETENSRIQEESKKAMESVKMTARSYLIIRAICRILFYWSLLIALFGIFSLYRKRRIAVGFCGHEVYEDLISIDRSSHPIMAQYADALEKAFKISCVPCPPHAICSKYSTLSCKPDYTISKPWNSLFGIIPTFDTCVLDSEKVSKIDKIIRLTSDTLAKRNAAFQCGTGTDEEVGLNYEDLQSILMDQMDMQDTDEFEYLWNKALVLLHQKPELAFHTDTEFVRSTSLSKLSINCKVKRIFVKLLVRLKYWLIGIAVIGTIAGTIYYKIHNTMKERLLIKQLTEKSLHKLQEQSTSFRYHEVEHRYIGKIQLRDYYLSDPSMKQKKKLNIWEKVAKVVEKNSNVSSYQLEVNGEIMKVWEWASDI